MNLTNLTKSLKCFIVLLLAIGPMHAQDLSDEALEKLEDEQLHSLFNTVASDSIKAERVARFYLRRARNEKDSIKMGMAYNKLAMIFRPKRNMQFIDSAISLTKNSSHITYPAHAYMTKAFLHYEMNNLPMFTEYCFKGYEIALKNGNLTQQLNALNNLILVKTHWGNINEVLGLLKKCEAIIDNPEYRGILRNVSLNKHLYEQRLISQELNVILNYTIVYTHLGKLDSASQYLKEGLEKSRHFTSVNTPDYYTTDFTRIGARIDLYGHRYGDAISKIDLLLASTTRPDVKKDPLRMFELYLVKGLSYLGMDGRNEEGISFLRKADSIHRTKKVPIEPFMRVLFEKLLAHYKAKGNTEKRIEYLNKLLKIDSVFKINYLYFDPKIIEKLETPLLMAEKETLITGLKQRNRKSIAAVWWIGSSLGTCILFLGYYVQLQRRYKKRFIALMADGDKHMNREDEVLQKLGKREVPTDITKMIREQLASFKMEQGYLTQDISLQSLAKSFGTNSSYLSKVINGELGKSFSTYISDLRAQYMFQKLKEDPGLRRYTIKALAHESGFKSAESFSKAFYRLYGIYPSYYLTQLNKVKKEKTPGSK